jgi:hypothetical protein
MAVAKKAIKREDGKYRTADGSYASDEARAFCMTHTAARDAVRTAGGKVTVTRGKQSKEWGLSVVDAPIAAIDRAERKLAKEKEAKRKAKKAAAKPKKPAVSVGL